MAKKFRTVISHLFLGCALLAGAAACEKQATAPEQTVVKKSGWIENFEEAKQAAKQAKLPIFVLFTGSDWCPWCVKLEEEVLATPEFKAFAQEKLILFKADYLRGKPMPPNLKAQNDELKNRLGVQGFPTVFLLDAEGQKLGQTGYQRGGGSAYVDHLKKLLKPVNQAAPAK